MKGSKNKAQRGSKIITIARYEDEEMAFILIDKELVFLGNYWDFHPNCHGTSIGGYELKGLWSGGIDSLAYALKQRMDQSGLKAQVVNKTLSSKEYQSLME